ncbi:MAG TPA: cytochrome c [Rhizomicrobium sp.]|nr:cytochrome c [Rhizomicrobium sp.]
MGGSIPSNPFCKWSILAGLAILLLLGAIALLGGYNVAADAPHTRPVAWFLQTARDRSITAQAKDVVVPADLGSAARIVAGAGLYNEMCSGCHLGPGLEPSEISHGLYPRAPELRRGSPLSPAEEFWVIKHGIKMTGMAAWGPTHNDNLIWNMVAFLQKLPRMSAVQYQQAVKSAPQDHDEMMKGMKMDDGHHH